MKLSKFKLVLFLSLFLFMVPSNPQPVHAWGLIVHQFIAEEAVNELDVSWQEVFDALIIKLKSGSIYPDSLHPVDTPNHLYYPDNPSYGTAPDAVEKFYNFFVANLTAHNYYDAVFSAGMFSHYMADVNIPVHTDAYWPGHNAFETDINKYLDTLTVGTITIDDNITDIKQYVKDAAINAHQYYDDVRSVYVDGSVTDQINTNATLKAMVEGQLTHAISNVASLFIKGIGEAIAPTVQITSTHKALIDGGHGNDYADGSLANIQSYLTGLGFSVSLDTDGITDSDLNGVDFLIISAIDGTGNYTQTELNSLATWIDGGQRSIFVTGRGDFNDISFSGINEILSTLGSVIRMNDDNVYTNGLATNGPVDPNYYQDWYIYSDVTTPPPGEKYQDTAILYHSFSPNSLYFSGPSSGLTVLVNGSQYNYQSDENAPVPAKVWDNVNDGVGGEVIPLVAAEQLNSDDDRIIVFGATDFSDFSFIPSGYHDDQEFLTTSL